MQLHRCLSPCVFSGASLAESMATRLACAIGSAPARCSVPNVQPRSGWSLAQPCVVHASRGHCMAVDNCVPCATTRITSCGFSSAPSRNISKARMCCAATSCNPLQPVAVTDAACKADMDDTAACRHTGDAAAVCSMPASDAAALSKAEARKARRTPPSLISPPDLPQDSAALAAAFGNGVLLIDKPKGWTSFDVCGKIRNALKFLGIKKVGHAGTLDPMATGLLVVCTGAGTKFADDYMAQAKVYTGTMRLGETTPSYDAEMEVTQTAPWEHVTDEALQAAAASLVGEVMQVPPMYAAIKVGGQKLYEVAREGGSLELQARPVTITSLRVWRATAGPPPYPPPPIISRDNRGPSSVRGLRRRASGATAAAATGDPTIPDSTAANMDSSTDGSTPGSSADAQYTVQETAHAAPRAQDVHFEVACSKGTYVRAIARDLGEALGTVAHLTALRREAVGSMHVGHAWQMPDLIKQMNAARTRLGGSSTCIRQSVHSSS